MVFFEIAFSVLLLAFATVNFVHYYESRLWILSLSCSVAIVVSLLSALWAGHDIKKRRKS